MSGDIQAKKTQLKDFYRIHDPSREKNVDPIFAKFTYPEIYTAVLQKYGQVPKTWAAPQPARPQVPSTSRKPNLTAFRDFSQHGNTINEEVDQEENTEDVAVTTTTRTQEQDTSSVSTPPPAAEHASNDTGLEITSPDDPELEKYKKMRKAGLPQGAVENCMTRDGYHPSCLYGDEVVTTTPIPVPGSKSNGINDSSSKSKRKSERKSKKIAKGRKSSRRPKPIPPTPPTPPEFLDGVTSRPSGSSSKPPPPSRSNGSSSKPPPPSRSNGSSAKPPPPSRSNGSSAKPPPPSRSNGSSAKPPPPSRSHGLPSKPPPPSRSHGLPSKPPPPSRSHGLPSKPPPPSRSHGPSKPPPPTRSNGSSGKPPPPSRAKGSSPRLPAPTSRNPHTSPGISRIPGQPSSPSATTTVPSSDPNDSLEMPPSSDEVYGKYKKMQKAGLPQGAIENCMIRDGIHPSGLFGANVMTCAPRSAAGTPAAGSPQPASPPRAPGRKPPPPQGRKNASQTGDKFRGGNPPKPQAPRKPPGTPSPSNNSTTNAGGGGGFDASSNFASKKNLIASRLAGMQSSSAPKREVLKPSGPSSSVLEKQKALASIFGGPAPAASAPAPKSNVPKAKKWPVPTDNSVNTLATGPQGVLGNAMGQSAPGRPGLGQAGGHSGLAAGTGSSTLAARSGPSAPAGGAKPNDPTGFQEMWSEEYNCPFYFNPYTGESLWEAPPGFGTAPKVATVVGKYDFRPQDPNNPNEMPIRAGDVLEVLEEGGDGWGKYKNTKTGKVGLVPLNYVGPM